MNVSESNSESLDDLLNNLRDIEQRIEESRIRGCVMFTDLSGYTAYVDRYGDVAGRRRVQSARECVSAAADRHNGRIIKGLGDGWMLLFESAQEAVLASVEMQRCVQFSQREEINPIKLKIGLDYGGILEDEDDIYGDVVNVSSRLTDLCKGDDIVISRSVFDHIDPYYQQRCSPKSEFAIRGKSSKASIYELDWRANAIPRSRGQRTEKLEIEILWNGNESRVSLRTKEDGSETLMSYETHELELETIESHSEEIQKLIRKANLQGSIGESLANLENRGKALFDLLFTAKVRQDIQKSASSYILLKLDDSCVHLPWELLHDGVDFLCCRFAVGRTVRTSQPIHELKRVPPTEKIHLLLISDPSGNLPAAAKEGEGLYDLCRHDTRVELELLRSRVTPEAVKGRLGEFDVVHYCGHADHFGDRPDESGWLMSGGNLTAKHVMELFKGATAAPLMVFNNACYGGTTEAWNEVTEHESFGFANAFLRAGCTHYIGAVSEILDPTGEDFSKYFYRHVVAGISVGDSLRRARIETRSKKNCHSLTWAQYVLYGDPELSVFSQPQLMETEEWPTTSPDEGSEGNVETPDQELLVGTRASGASTGAPQSYASADSSNSIPGHGQNSQWLMAAAMVAFLLLGGWLIWNGSAESSRERADRYFSEGQFELAGAAYSEASENDPEDVYLRNQLALTRQKIREAKALEREQREQQERENVIAGLENLEDKIRTMPEDRFEGDRWSSTPMSVAMIGFDLKGDPLPEEGEISEALLQGLQSRFAQTVRWTVLDRKNLLSVLQEQRISVSEAADPSQSTRIGNLLSARFLVTGTLVHGEGATTATIRAIDVGTREMVGTDNVNLDDSMDSAVDRLFEVLIDRLSKKHPLKGLIVDWADREKRLNIGSAEGVEPGQVFNFYFIPDNDPDPWGEPRFRPIGEIRVKRVEDHTASFEVLQSESDPKPGMKVKQKLEEN